MCVEPGYFHLRDSITVNERLDLVSKADPEEAGRGLSFRFFAISRASEGEKKW